jgi:hypothetical protein
LQPLLPTAILLLEDCTEQVPWIHPLSARPHSRASQRQM